VSVQVRGGRIPPKEHRKLLTEDTVDYLLERLIFARAHDAAGIRADCKFRPEDMGPMWASSPLQEDRLFWHPSQVNHPKLVWPVACGSVFHVRQNPDWGDHLHCTFAQNVPAKVLRGAYRWVGPYNLGMYDGYLEKSGKWSSVVSYASWHWGAWRDAGRLHYDDAFLKNVRPEGGAPISTGLRVDADETPIGEQAAMAQSIALTYRYEWGAQFAIDGSPRIIIPVTPEGVVELFNDRNKPSDANRRAALRHWVSQHLRAKPGGDFRQVRRHLRGEVKFQWRGFDVLIRPSQYDLEQNEAGKAEVVK
jgi:hypothetical protein